MKIFHNQTTNPKQTFTLPDNNIDTTTIKVGVSPTSTTTDIAVYNLVTDILDVTNDSQVYYLQETKKELKSNQSKVEKIIAVGKYVPKAKNNTDLAATMQMIQVIYNMQEAITKT